LVFGTINTEGYIASESLSVCFSAADLEVASLDFNTNQLDYTLSQVSSFENPCLGLILIESDSRLPGVYHPLHTVSEEQTLPMLHLTTTVQHSTIPTPDMEEPIHVHSELLGS
jgi:hypothetical protein